jgi:hypothetical protein
LHRAPCGKKGMAGAHGVVGLHSMRGGLGGGLGDARMQVPTGSAAQALGGKCLAIALRRAQQRRAAACDSGAAARSDMRGQFSPQSVASSEGMEVGGLR